MAYDLTNKKISETFHQLPHDFDMLYLSYLPNDREMFDSWFKIQEDFPDFQYNRYFYALILLQNQQPFFH